MNAYVKKPLLSREGANITIVNDHKIIESNEGEYGEEGFVYQEYMELENDFGQVALIGSWIIGGEAAGIGIRESKSKITDNTSRFIPHYIEH
jgi:glutathionylspermidine synthase